MGLKITSKSKTNPSSLKDYLGSRDLTEHFQLTKELSFHWANWDQTCLAQIRHYKNFNNNFHLIQLNEMLQKLKYQPVWLCNKGKVIRTDLFALYESYLGSRLRLTWFERKDEILFSSESEQGPFFTLISMKWLDKEVYAQFVMRKILLEYYALRSFRLNATIPIHFKMDNDEKVYKDKVTIHQLSEFGFNFKITDKKFINKIKHSKALELTIPVRPYQNIELLKTVEGLRKLDQHQHKIENDSLVFKLDSKILNFYGNLNNAKRSPAEEFYIFARYEDLIPVDHDTDLKNIFSSFVGKTKDFFSSELTELENMKRNMQFFKQTA